MSKHFSMAELTFSQTATRRGIENNPPPVVAANLDRLAETLEQVRSLIGPLTVSSGYRSPALNMAVGGARDSAHLRGLAADITAGGVTPKALALLIRESGIEFDQLIWEGTWVHLGLSEGPARRQVLTASFTNGKANYIEGIT